MDWYPWFLKDYRRDTRHLGLAADGAYRRLIDEYMETREPLPDSDAALAGIVRVGLDEWLKIAADVRPFFRSKDGLLFHKRCDRELRAQNVRILRNSERGKKAAFGRWSKPKGLDASRMLAHATLTLSKNTSLTSSESVAEEATEKRKSAASPETLEDVIRRKGWA